MGDRVSIQFTNGRESSAVLFSHWDGMSLVEAAKEHVKQLHRERNGSELPLDRFEPGTVMMDFINTNPAIPAGSIESNYYIMPTEFDGDNGDNGHFLINTD